MAEDKAGAPDQGDVKAPEGVWASCIRLVDPTQSVIHATVELDENEAAFWCDHACAKRGRPWCDCWGVA